MDDLFAYYGVDWAGIGLTMASIHLLGSRTDVFALMARADVVALPSRVEGHPLALLESLAQGAPVFP